MFQYGKSCYLCHSSIDLLQDKPALFKSFYKWLKPGGKLLISDYCRSDGTPTEEFADYIKQRGYDLHDVKAYGQASLTTSHSALIWLVSLDF